METTEVDGEHQEMNVICSEHPDSGCVPIKEDADEPKYYECRKCLEEKYSPPAPSKDQ